MSKPSSKVARAAPSGARSRPDAQSDAQPLRDSADGLSIAGVAEQAGVSVATVSRVLNGHENVRPATRDKVLAAIDASGYRVNELARNLRTAESRLLLTMVPDVGNPFYAEIVRGIDSVARQHGYFMLLCDTGADPGRERSYFDLLRRRSARPAARCRGSRAASSTPRWACRSWASTITAPPATPCGTCCRAATGASA